MDSEIKNLLKTAKEAIKNKNPREALKICQVGIFIVPQYGLIKLN
jgi:hypothetical protein